MGFGSSLLVVSWGVPMFSAFWSFYFAVGFPALDVWRCVVGVRLLALSFWVCVSALVLALGFGHSDFGIGLLALGLWRWTFHVFPLLFSSFVILGLAAPKVEFFPENQPQQIFIYAEYPEGTAIDKTNATSKRIEAVVAKVIGNSKYIDGDTNFMIDSNVAMVGLGAQNPETDKGGDQEMPHKAKITLTMAEFKYRRGASSESLRSEIQRNLKGKYPGILISVEKDSKGPPVGYPVNIEVSGRDYEKLILNAKK